MVTGTLPASPDRVIVPSESTRTRAVSSSRLARMVDSSFSPAAGSVRQPDDSARSSASAYGSLMPVGSSMIDVKASRSALARATRAMYSALSSASRAFCP